jgi:hypothetical protein
MKKTSVSVFILLLLSAPCWASTPFTATLEQNFAEVVPQAMILEVRSDNSVLTTPLASVTVPGPFDLGSRGTGITWTVTATNAADYGADWAELNSALGSIYPGPRSAVLTLHVPHTLFDGSTGHLRLQRALSPPLAAYNAERIEFRWAPFHTSATVYGTRALVPEPATATCVVLLLAIGLLTRRHRPMP